MTRVIPVAIVTGASRGIGRAILQKLSREGVSCLAIASSKESIARINIGNPLFYANDEQRHRSLAIDLSQWPQWTYDSQFSGIDYQNADCESSYTLLDMLRSWSSPSKRYYLDLLVNCAGVTQTTLSLSTDPGSISRIMNVNFMSCVSLSNIAVKQMIRDRRYNKSTPSIINISSILSNEDQAIPGTSIYAASKAALNQYSRVLSKETSKLNIAIETISPGLVADTDMIKKLDVESQARLHESISENSVKADDIALDVWNRYYNTKNT